MSERTSVECPSCGSHYCPTYKVKHHTVRWRGKEVVHTRRLRECAHCGRRFTTVECLEDDNQIGFPAAKNPDPVVPPKKPFGSPRPPPETPSFPPKTDEAPPATLRFRRKFP